MGVGIFAARKIALLNSINNLELMMTMLSSRQMKLSEQCMDISMQQNNMSLQYVQPAQQAQGGNIWSALGSVAAPLGQGLGGDKYGGLATAGIGLVSALGMMNSGGGGSSSDPNAALRQKQVELDNRLLQLQQQEKRLEMTMKTLETQLSQKNQELQSVEKGEEAAIKRSAPKYGD